MRRRLNGTGRSRIDHQHARVALREAEGGDRPIVEVALDLTGYGFPDDARVRVEAWRDRAVQRWDWGAAGAPLSPPEDERRLTLPDSAQFRVIVVASDGSGLLFGHAPNIRPLLPRRSLLPVRESADLGDEVWRVDFGDGMDQPELLINPDVEGISEIVRGDEAFRSLVMPNVLRTILRHIVFVERGEPNDDEGPWRGWFGIARSLLPDEPPRPLRDNADETEKAAASRWIDGVVEVFADDRVAAAKTYNAVFHGRRS